jgi:hypothetical protein
MLDSARRSVADAKQTSISPETRLDAAYRAITQLSMIALWANGFRPARSKPGHHQTMIQCLVHTIELARYDVLLLDTLRAKRNAVVAGWGPLLQDMGCRRSAAHGTTITITPVRMSMRIRWTHASRRKVLC